MTTAYSSNNNNKKITLKVTPSAYRILNKEPERFISVKNQSLVSKLLENEGSITMEGWNGETSKEIQNIEKLCNQYLQESEAKKFPQSKYIFAAIECYNLIKEVIVEAFPFFEKPLKTNKK